MNSSAQQSKIGIIDSGLGGLTVLKELQQQLPNEAFVYFGDNANCPYGNRSEEEILLFSQTMIEFLMREPIKMVVIACNTISILEEFLHVLFPFPVIGIIKPIAALVSKENRPSIGVFATEFTIHSNGYTLAIQKGNPNMQVFGIESRVLAKYIDLGQLDTPTLHAEIETMVARLQHHTDVDTVILGCTHYPIVQEIFTATAPKLHYLDPAKALVQYVKNYLEQQHLLRPPSSVVPTKIFTSATNLLPFEIVLAQLKITDYTIIAAPNRIDV